MGRLPIQIHNAYEVVTLNVNETETKKYVKQAIHAKSGELTTECPILVALDILGRLWLIY